MKQARIEIVRSRAKKLYTPGATRGQLQYHVRVRAANGQILVASETYTRRRTAIRCAVVLLSLGPTTKAIGVDETGDEKK